mgnify:CR=1 FL=1|jgi:hypothetical protein
MSTTFEQKRQTVLTKLQVASDQLEETRKAAVNRTPNRDAKITKLDASVKSLLKTVKDIDSSFKSQFLKLSKEARDMGANVNASNTNRNSLGYQFGMVKYGLFGPSFKANHSMPKFSSMDDILNNLSDIVKTRANRIKANKNTSNKTRKNESEANTARRQRQANLAKTQKNANEQSRLLGQLNKTKSQLNIIAARAGGGSTVTVDTSTLLRLRQNIENKNTRNFLESKGYNLSRVENGSVSASVAERMNRNLANRKKNM